MSARRPPFEAPIATALGALCIVVTACADGAADASTPNLVPTILPEPTAVWTARPAPIEIGVREGAEPYLLHDALSALRMADGRTAVLDASSRQIRFYDAQGRHVASVGGKGEGPGEYRLPVRMYLTHADSILVWDVGTGRETRLDADGRFVWSSPWQGPEGEPFPRDAWLHGRHFVDGPMTPEQRPLIRAVLDRLPPLSDAAQYRHVKVDDHARLWIRTEPRNASPQTMWQVWGLDGAALARVSLPAGFEPQHIGRDFIVGRTWDAMNVESIRLFTLEGTTAQRVTGRAARRVDGRAPAGYAAHAPSRELRERMLAVLRHAMSQQEMFYSAPANGYTYASRTDALTWPDELMGGLIPHIIEGTPRGWAMLLFHETEPIACGVRQGSGGPIGWTAGIAVCQ